MKMQLNTRTRCEYIGREWTHTVYREKDKRFQIPTPALAFSFKIFKTKKNENLKYVEFYDSLGNTVKKITREQLIKDGLYTNRQTARSRPIIQAT